MNKIGVQIMGYIEQSKFKSFGIDGWQQHSHRINVPVKKGPFKNRTFTEYRKVIIHGGGWKIKKGFTAAIITIASVGFALLFQDVRKKWKQAFNGKELKTVKVLNVVEGSSNSQTHKDIPAIDQKVKRTLNIGVKGVETGVNASNLTQNLADSKPKRTTLTRPQNKPGKVGNSSKTQVDSDVETSKKQKQDTSIEFNPLPMLVIESRYVILQAEDFIENPDLNLRNFNNMSFDWFKRTMTNGSYEHLKALSVNPDRFEEIHKRFNERCEYYDHYLFQISKRLKFNGQSYKVTIEDFTAPFNDSNLRVLLLTDEEIKKLTISQINIFNESQRNVLYERINDLNFSEMGKQTFPDNYNDYTISQLSTLSGVELAALLKSGQFAPVSKLQLLQPNSLFLIPLGDLEDDQFQVIYTPENIEKLQPQHLKTFIEDVCIRNKKILLGHIKTSVIGRIDSNDLDVEVFKNVIGLELWGPYGHKIRIEAMSSTQILQALSKGCFDSTTMPYITDKHLEQMEMKKLLDVQSELIKKGIHVPMDKLINRAKLLKKNA